jgi:hypothetical protein
MLSHPITQVTHRRRPLLLLALVILVATFGAPARASIAYGSINNFDCVNDTGTEAHGFDIELDDTHSTDITYTYDWNHYGVPQISEDISPAGKPMTRVRYAAKRSPNGTWTAYTAIPAGPIAPTQGHQFTDPSVNFGGEHFGLGYTNVPTAVRYYWLVDDGTGSLVHGPPVSVATPVFNYNPPVGNIPAVIVPVIAPPPPPVPPAKQFGKALWVKSIKTKTHNARKIPLRDLVGDDEGKPQPWANGEPDEVETEWRILQTGGANDELVGGDERLEQGDEVVTRRYEFYEYSGPLDAESGEAMATEVGQPAPGGHYFGTGTVTFNDYFDQAIGEWVEATVDLATVEVLGDYIGAQMAAVDVNPMMGLIDNIQDGDVGVAFPDRTVVIAGPGPFTASVVGLLPGGLALGAFSGVLSGTPETPGTYTFTVKAEEIGGAAVVEKSYTVTIAGDAAATCVISTSASPAVGGVTAGDGSYTVGDPLTVTATPNAGYQFSHWSENGALVSADASYDFTATVDRVLVAHFTVIPLTAIALAPQPGNVPVLGNALTFIATPTGGAEVEYLFKAGYKSGAGYIWITLRPYAQDAVCVWTPGEARTWSLVAYAREVGSPKPYDVYRSIAYTVQSALSAVRITPNLKAPQPVGGAVLLTAVHTGGSNVEYQFRQGYKSGVSWVWTVVRSYATDPTFLWMPSTPRPWTLVVWAREVGGRKAYDVFSSLSYTVYPTPPTAVTVRVVGPATGVTGTAVSLQATPTGGSHVQYRFRMAQRVGGVLIWTTLQEFGDLAEYRWTPPAAGTYIFATYAREVGSPKVYDCYGTVAYTAKP